MDEDDEPRSYWSCFWEQIRSQKEAFSSGWSAPLFHALDFLPMLWNWLRSPSPTDPETLASVHVQLIAHGLFFIFAIVVAVLVGIAMYFL